MRLLQWIDRHLWSIPVIAFVVVGVAVGLWGATSSKPVLLAAAPPAARQAVYSSLTGSSTALLGLAIAGVAILVAFSPRQTTTSRSAGTERRLARARTIITGSLLAASFFMLVVVITATIALGIDVRHAGNTVITALIEASGIASATGILVGGVGLALVIIERSRQ